MYVGLFERNLTIIDDEEDRPVGDRRLEVVAVGGDRLGGVEFGVLKDAIGGELCGYGLEECFNRVGGEWC